MLPSGGTNRESALITFEVEFEDEDSLGVRIAQAIQATEHHDRRIAVRLSNEGWENAGAARSAQLYAIVLLDALCSALLVLEQQS